MSLRQRVHVLLPLVLSVCALPACGSAPSGLQSQRATVAGRERRWLLHLPRDYAVTRTWPLVVIFHGHYGTPAGIARLTGLDRMADREGFIAVYPAGIARSWAAGLNAPADRMRIDDVAFVSGLIARLETEYPIDTRHVVLAGFSNGAHLVELLGCRLAAQVTAIVPVSGTLAAAAAGGCHPARPLTVVEFHGMQDPVDPYSGGVIHVHHGGAVLPVITNIEDWARWDRCPGPARQRHLGVADHGARELTYGPCAAGTTVRLYALEDGGHTWPGGPQYLPSFIIGAATHVINASAILGDVAVRGAPPPGE